MVGRRRLPSAWRRTAILGAGVGLAITLVSATPGLRHPFDSLTSTVLGAPLREGQRFVVLFLLWATVASAHGVAALSARWREGYRWLGLVLPILALALALPSLWGVEGRLRPAGLEPSWEDAQRLISARPGSVVALPFSQYVNLPDSGRRVLHPAAQYLRADVIKSYDPGFHPGVSDEADPRANTVTAALSQLADDDLADALALVGVRWLVVVPSLDGDLERALRTGASLRVALDNSSMLLVENELWYGPGLAPDGSPIPVDQVVALWASTPTHEPVRWLRASAPGWLRGLSPAHRAPDGTLHLPAGSGPVWFWPATLVLSTDLAMASAVVLVVRRRRRLAHNAPNHA